MHRILVLFYNIFPHYLTNGTIFEKRKVTEHKMSVLIFSIQLFWSNFNETLFFSERLKKYSTVEFHENPFSWSQVISYGQTNMTELIAAFRKFANAPKT